jgi:hypothetical protein
MEAEKKFHPYLPWKTFFNLLLQMEERGLPARIDRSYLQGRSGADQSYLISTLKSFRLIGQEGEVEDSLRELVQDKENRPERIAALLRENYPEVMALAANATQQQLDEVFRAYGLSSNTLRKAETFLLHGAAYAGMKLSPHFTTPRSAPPAGRSNRKGKEKRTGGTGAETQTPITPQGGGDDPAERRRQALFDVLLKKLDSADTYDEALVDRLERIAGTLKEGGAG